MQVVVVGLLGQVSANLDRIRIEAGHAKRFLPSEFHTTLPECALLAYLEADPDLPLIQPSGGIIEGMLQMVSLRYIELTVQLERAIVVLVQERVIRERLSILVEYRAVG